MKAYQILKIISMIVFCLLGGMAMTQLVMNAAETIRLANGC